MSVITPIQLMLCPSARAGLVRIWAVSCKDVVDVLIDDNSMVYNVILDTGVEWQEIQFEPDTAFLIQEKFIARGYTEYVRQQVYFEIHGLSAYVRNRLEDLNGECCMNVIAQDKAGNFHYLGISETEEGERFEGLKTNDGSSVTGADPQTDVAMYTETLECICDFYALITLNPNDFNPIFWTKPDDDFWTKPDDQLWTIKNN